MNKLKEAKAIFALIIVLIVAMYGTASAQVVMEDPAFAGETQLLWKRSDNKDTQMDLFVQTLYLERRFGEKVGVFVYGYRDKEFKEVVVGPRFKVNEHLQVGIAPGVARYDKKSHVMIMLWSYYTSEKWEALISHEWYAKEKDEPHFMKWYLKRSIGNGFSFGLYGESEYGFGPALWYRYGSLVFSVAHAVARRPAEGGTGTIFTVTYEFGQ